MDNITSKTLIEKIKEINKYKTEKKIPLDIDFTFKPPHLSQKSPPSHPIQNPPPPSHFFNPTQPIFKRRNRNNNVSNTTKETGKLNIITNLNNTPSSIVTPLSKLTFKEEHHETALVKEHVHIGPSYTIKHSQIVSNFAYIENQNISYKEKMEDKGICIEHFNSQVNQALFCLFDGHGGDLVSKHLQKYFYKVYQRVLNAMTNVSIEKAMRIAFKQIDEDIKTLGIVSMGSTGTVVHVIRENPSIITVHCANIGDTRCSLISSVEYERLTYDHRADDETERKRILLCGGSVFNGRVMGQLMLSRAFGDFEFKSFGVKSEPYYSENKIHLSKRNQYLILACDGIWDVLDENEIKDLIVYGGSEWDSERLAKNIMKYSFARGAWDNLSLFAIKLS